MVRKNRRPPACTNAIPNMKSFQEWIRIQVVAPQGQKPSALSHHKSNLVISLDWYNLLFASAHAQRMGYMTHMHRFFGRMMLFDKNVSDISDEPLAPITCHASLMHSHCHLLYLLSHHFANATRFSVMANTLLTSRYLFIQCNATQSTCSTWANSSIAAWSCTTKHRLNTFIGVESFQDSFWSDTF